MNDVLASDSDPSSPRQDAATAPHGPGTPQSAARPYGGFEVRLDVFEGPFDLLLGLIAKHKLDITELALSKVTDDFISYIRSGDRAWDLGQATEFLVVAATLLDLKAARLLPAAEVEDEEDLALLEARDLLFARLLQYRAYKQIAAIFAERMASESRRFPRTVGLDPQFANLLPEVLIGLGPGEFAALAARAMTAKPTPVLSIEHIHAARVSVREQADLLVERLRRSRTSTFRGLTADADGTIVVVARFLALLELYREGAVSFEQLTALGELTIRWTGADDGDVTVGDEFDTDDTDPDDTDPDDTDPGDTDTGDTDTSPERNPGGPAADAGLASDLASGLESGTAPLAERRDDQR